MGTGFSDEDLAKHHEFFQSHVIDKPRPYYRYGDSVTPDHWFEAVQVCFLFIISKPRYCRFLCFVIQQLLTSNLFSHSLGKTGVH